MRRGLSRQYAIPDIGNHDEILELSGALREMTEALWKRMDAIEGFAADVAHEIKNPLTSLRSAIETASRISDPAQQQKLMAIVIDDIQRLDRLISDISNASRLDAELSRAETRPVDLAAMLGMLLEVHEATRSPEQARLVLTLPAGGALWVPGLADRLVQVFQNLIATALSFSPPGGVVTLAARPVSDDWVEASVSDQGPYKDFAHGFWVAGRPTTAGEVPLSGQATYAGHVVAAIEKPRFEVTLSNVQVGADALLGGTLDDGAILSMNWLAEGVQGKLPQ